MIYSTPKNLSNLHTKKKHTLKIDFAMSQFMTKKKKKKKKKTGLKVHWLGILKSVNDIS